MNKNRWIVIGVVIAFLAITSIVVYYYYYVKISPPSVVRHIFKVKEIYPTKPGGREWFINMDNPQSDGIFDPGSPITKQSDGSWQISGTFRPANKYEDQVRMAVGTPEGEMQWKNVEITGYAKVLSADSSTDHLDWYARGGVHSNEVPCVGSALKGTISVDGKVSWIKEIWHTGGYTKPRDVHKVTDSILDEWIGWKVVIYNINDNTAVKMESYLDNNDNNHWRKVSDIMDNGGWYAKSSDEEFYSARCSKPKDYIITNSGPLVTFRSDNMVWDFADLSVREIQPPSLK
jgi:hypothetical protein